MNTETKVFLKKRLKDYYWRNRVEAPSEVGRREFGVGTLEDKIKFRHKGFQTERDLNNYLQTEAPYYISYSAAYYEFPENQPIESKNWLGADLIFDLDMPMQYLDSEKLSRVKEEALVLIDFLKGDFGFSGQDIKVNFSGSKGYHVHVAGEEVKKLNGDERREIVDYLTGTGLAVDSFLHAGEDAQGIVFKRGKPAMADKTTPSKMLGPKADSRGWGRIIYEETKKLIMSSREELEKIDGVGPKTAQEIVENRENLLKLLKEGRWSYLVLKLKSRIQKQIMAKVVSITDDDKMVTIDTSRLIRLPDTIHGGSGLLARKARSLDSFNPLEEAVAFGEGKVKFRMTKDVPAFDLRGGPFGPYKNSSEIAAPEHVAVYLMLKDSAEIII